MHRTWNYVIWSRWKRDMEVQTAHPNSVVTRAVLDWHPENIWTAPEEHQRPGIAIIRGINMCNECIWLGIMWFGADVRGIWWLQQQNPT
jgi:hypothetical protein